MSWDRGPRQGSTLNKSRRVSEKIFVPQTEEILIPHVHNVSSAWVLCICRSTLPVSSVVPETGCFINDGMTCISWSWTDMCLDLQNSCIYLFPKRPPIIPRVFHCFLAHLVKEFGWPLHHSARLEIVAEGALPARANVLFQALTAKEQEAGRWGSVSFLLKQRLQAAQRRRQPLFSQTPRLCFPAPQPRSILQ